MNLFEIISKSSLTARVAIFSFVSWLVYLIATCLFVGYVIGVRKETFDKVPSFIIVLLIILVGLGCLAFGIGVLSLTVNILLKNSKKQNPIVFFIKLVFTILILPIYLILYIINPIKIFKTIKEFGLGKFLKFFKIRSLLLKIVGVLTVLTTLLPIWLFSYMVAGIIIANQLGYIAQDIAIVGTGSMYPTWDKGTKGKSSDELAKEIISTAGFLPYPNGILIGENRYFNHILGRGDIIIWENKTTRKLTSQEGGEPAGLIKRIIGLPGDTIEIRDGVVYLNGKAQKEPYIAKPHSTFGEKFLRECKAVTVPQGSVFAMGDNRKGSADSREIGFAPIKDISYVIPFSDQKGRLDAHWHDASADTENASKPKINKQRFVQLLNNKRKEKVVSELRYDAKLEKSAALRGEAILKYNDFEQKSPYQMEQSMADAGYWNTYWWEVPIEGYYDADELFEDYLERDWTDSKNTWFDAKFDDIGIAEVPGTLNGCPTQVIVIQVAGYIPAEYDKSDVQSWKDTLSSLKDIQPGWLSLRDNSDFYSKNKHDIDRINELIAQRISNISRITGKMDASQWLSSEEERMMNQDDALYSEQESIARRLNSL